MSNPRYAIRLKSLNRYSYRGTLYKRREPESRELNTYAVSRELRDHLVGTGFFLDVRSVEPTPVVPEPVAEPEIIGVGSEVPEVIPVQAVPPPTPKPPIEVKEGSGDMSRASVTGYGAPKPAAPEPTNEVSKNPDAIEV